MSKVVIGKPQLHPYEGCVSHWAKLGGACFPPVVM